MLLDRSGLSTRSRAAVRLAASLSVNCISVGLTYSTEVTAIPSMRSRERLLNPTPRTDTTVPAGNVPSPGTTSVIATLPPTVTVPGATLARTLVPFKFQSHDGSSVNCARLPAIASSRMRNATVRTGYSSVNGCVVTYVIATSVPSTTAAPAASPFLANIAIPSTRDNDAPSTRIHPRPPEIGVASVVLTFIWTMLPAGAVSSGTRKLRSGVSRPPAAPAPSANRHVTVVHSLIRNILITLARP